MALGLAVALMVRLVAEPDVANAQDPVAAVQADSLLTGLSGVPPVACELMIGAWSNWWGWGGLNRLPDGDARVSRMAQDVSNHLDEPAVVRVVARHFNGGDACVRRIAARLLGRSASGEALAALRQGAGSSDPAVRSAAVVGLGYRRRDADVATLRRALSDDAGSVRAAAAWALGNVESRESVGDLTRALVSDSDATVRRAAALALGEMD